MSLRTATLIRCSQEEAKIIHEMADAERRTVSAYILNIVERSLPFVSLYISRVRSLGADPTLRKSVGRHPGPKTAIHLRCSLQEAERMRAAAMGLGITLSGFVLHALRRSWKVKEIRSHPAYRDWLASVPNAQLRGLTLPQD